MSRFLLVQKKEKWTLTWRGRLLFLVFLILLLIMFIKTIVPFLSPNAPLQARLLVVEGFIPDYAVQEAVHIFHQGTYERMLITGKKREKGAHLDHFVNDGEYTAATLIRLGFDPGHLTVVAMDDNIRKDRTYQSALAIKEWMDQHRTPFESLDLVSVGTHSRRSRWLFEKAFEGKTKIGIYAIPNQSFDRGRWWNSSHGFREVTKETIAWIYARFFFYP